MKSKHQILAAIFLIIFSVSGIAGTPTLTFFGANGSIIEIPVKLEEATDSIPEEITEAYVSQKQLERQRISEKQFDIRELSRPEADANDVTIDTRSIFLDILFQDISAKK